MLERAVTTLDHFPSISQLEQIAVELHISQRSGWKYLSIADCLRCGGVGWHWVRTPSGAEASVACDDCPAGKNLQIGPQGTIKHTIKNCEPGTEYIRAGRDNMERPMHPKLQARLNRTGGDITSSLIEDMPMSKMDWRVPE